MKHILKMAVVWLIAAAHILCLPLLAALCVFSRFCHRNIDIGMGPVPLINNVHWAKALGKKGYTVETFVTGVYFITNEFDVRLDCGWRKLYCIIPGLWFIHCIFHYRCLYLYFNGGPLQTLPILRWLEPELFHLAGVKVIVMPYGSDSQVLERTPNKLTVNCLCNDYPAVFRKQHNRIKKQVDRWCRHADIVVGTMDSVDYLFGSGTEFASVIFAVDTQEIHPVYPQPPQQGETIKIFHAPNHLSVKGSASGYRRSKS